MRDVTPITAPIDPETLDVPSARTERELPPDAFDRHEASAGVAVVGVTNDRGDVLLIRNTGDGPDGWLLPYGHVEDEGWIETAVDWTDGLTGIVPEIETVLFVRENHLVAPDGRETTTHHVVFTATPAADSTPDGDVRYDCANDWTADWHTTVPENADGETRDDIERVLDQ